MIWLLQTADVAADVKQEETAAEDVYKRQVEDTWQTPPPGSATSSPFT